MNITDEIGPIFAVPADGGDLGHLKRRYKGSVVAFDKGKGQGTIKLDEYSEQVHFKTEDLEGDSAKVAESLAANQRLSFELSEEPPNDQIKSLHSRARKIKVESK